MRELIRDVVVGAGFSGLAVATASGATVFEAGTSAGGACRSYYRDGFHFEEGGGRWIFGGDPEVLAFVEQYSPLRRYHRRSGVWLPSLHELVVPFPLQAHLEYLPSRIRTQAERELSRETTAGHEEVQTQAQWLELQFGPTLNDLFFAPFHDSYTAGLYKEVAPQDAYKTPRAASRQHLYNEEFVYPSDGLDRVIQGMTTSMLGELRLNHRVTSVDPESKRLVIDGTNDVAFDRVALTVPLDQALELCHLSTGTPDPATGVLVLNLGAQRGSRCPDEHWVYVARAKSGFHRVGFYSNVDAEFSPHNTVGIYIEKAFLTRPNEQEQTRWAKQTIAELEEWEWIGAVEAMDVTWSYPAYTYVRPGSNWRADSLAALESIGVTMVGRYARWEFQGIAKSIAEGRRTGDHWRRLQPEVERANSRRPSA